NLDDYLEQEAGPQVKAKIAQRMLAEQAAQNEHLSPTDKEVEDDYNAEKERSYVFARTVALNPWRGAELKEEIRENLCKQRLLVKDVNVTNDELQEEYKRQPAAYDTPNKARTQLAVITD